MERIRQIFALDLRSLAVLRVCFGLLILADVLDRGRYIVDFQTDTGVLPTAALWGLTASNPTPSPYLCLHALSGDVWWQITLSCCTGLAALALTAGFYTRCATLLCWWLVLSVQMRNPLVFFGGDTILRMVLFWAIFLPWGRVWSWDARHKPPPVRNNVVGLACLGYLVQIAYQYFSSGMFKVSEHWVTEGSALTYSLLAIQYESAAGQIAVQFLKQHPSFSMALTFGVLAWERLFPLLLFCPYRTSLCRTLAVLSVWAFHGGLLVVMSLGLFAWIGMACAIGLIPSSWWDRIPRAALDLGQKVEEEEQKRGPWSQILAWLPVVAVCWTLVFGFADIPQVKYRLPRPLVKLAGSLGLNQSWMLFAPAPPTTHGFYLAVCRTEKQERFQLLGKVRPVSWTKPKLNPPSVGGMRWRMYCYRVFTRRGYRSYRQLLCEFLHHKWSANSPDKLEIIRLYYMSGDIHLDRPTNFKANELWKYLPQDSP